MESRTYNPCEALSRRNGLKRGCELLFRQRLTKSQEETLIAYVNKLNDRGFPPTPQILKNIAESIAHTTLGPNWTARFCKRHRNQLSSVYLRTIDHKRKVADNSKHFQHFFDLVYI